MTDKEVAEWLMAIKEKYIHGGDEQFDSCGKEALDIAAARMMESNKIRMFVDEAGKITPLNQRRKGHWQPYKYGDDTWHQCSACGVADRYINIVRRKGYSDERIKSKRNFCPNCGADMRGEQE